MRMSVAQCEVSLPVHSILYDTYKTKEVIATSKLSIVYLAETLNEGRQVTIKEFFPQELALRDLDNRAVINRLPSTKTKFEDLKATFLNEAIIMKQISHRNIVNFIDFFEENGTLYIIMDYYEGKLLDHYLKDISLNNREQLYTSIFLPLMDALSYLHKQGILHRDIKPSNIMIDLEGNPFLLDFGSAIFYKNAKEYQIFISPGYTPLEQYSNVSVQGVYTDMYSLAATFYYLLTNMVPPDISQRLIEDNIDHIRKYNKRVTMLLAHTIMWGMALQAKKRCPSLKVMKCIILFEEFVNRIRNYFKVNNTK